jgi:hypothetical protein
MSGAAGGSEHYLKQRGIEASRLNPTVLGAAG